MIIKFKVEIAKAHSHHDDDEGSRTRKEAEKVSGSFSIQLWQESFGEVGGGGETKINYSSTMQTGFLRKVILTRGSRRLPVKNCGLILG